MLAAPHCLFFSSIQIECLILNWAHVIQRNDYISQTSVHLGRVIRLDSCHWDTSRREYVQHLLRRLKGRGHAFLHYFFLPAIWDISEMAGL